MLKGILLVVGVFFLLVFSLIPGFLGPDDLDGCSARPTEDRQCASVDAIVTVSGGDTDARVAEAVKLYSNGWAPKLIFSGAARDTSGPSNATAMARQAVKAGVAPEAILTEGGSINTEQNAAKTSTLIQHLGAQRIILVTSVYHQRRAYMEFHAVLGSEVKIVNHPAPLDDGWSRLWWLSPMGWWLALGELAKILFLAIQGVAVW